MSEIVPGGTVAPVALDALAVQIRNDIGAADKHWQSAVTHAIRAGDGLIKAKARVQHGEWLPWLEANFPDFSERSAQSYMRMARNRNAVADLGSIREAVALLAAPKVDVPKPDDAMGRDEAQRLSDEAAETIAVMRAMLAKAHREGVHTALGHASWAEYVAVYLMPLAPRGAPEELRATFWRWAMEPVTGVQWASTP